MGRLAYLNEDFDEARSHLNRALSNATFTAWGVSVEFRWFITDGLMECLEREGDYTGLSVFHQCESMA